MTDTAATAGDAPARGVEEPSTSQNVIRVLNFVGMIGMLAVALSAYGYQFSKQELPCTLCLLQRVAMIGVAFGAAMNLKFGPRPRHYALCLISAAFGLAVSFRQTLLHINPYFDTTTDEPTLSAATNPPFGEPVLGLHLYVWGLVIFGVAILATGIVQLFPSQWKPVVSEPAWLRKLATIGVVILLVIAAAEALSTFAECGPRACPDDGGWNWWLF